MTKAPIRRVECGRGFPTFPHPAGEVQGCAPSPENFSLLTLENAHFGGYLTHSGVLI